MGQLAYLRFKSFLHTSRHGSCEYEKQNNVPHGNQSIIFKLLQYVYYK